MNITTLITKQYTTLDAYTGARLAKELLRVQDVVVVVENSKPIGILTASDLAMKSHQLVIDCLRDRPTANCMDSIDTVLNLMKITGNTVLPVSSQGSFCGLIKQSDILFHLHANHEQQKIALLAAAHDLRSPIAAINMLGTILKADPALNKHQYLIDKISETCDYAQILIQDILTTEQAQEDAVILADENLDELVDTCTASLSDKFEGKQLVLSKQLLSNKVVKVDRPKLMRAISNILWNSIKFTHPGGTISVSTEESPDGQALLVVQDTGIGVPKAMQEKIFDKFTKAKRPGTSGEPTTGLGLYLTKTVIESHGGTIGMESDGQSGTRFIVSLPAENHSATQAWA
ncbi:ATP-binding protein [Parapedobacter indicus]|uniref:histidine kinase n=1 Tax=Parapedobacter indicus TaxID=1477437 RepID=A0A1I3GSG9_9SPHI|nr:ATP-binding protein [Parapedobacter indicus]PPL02764.1 histidine kinase/DNA gyrase B/HSP90-like ATPase [Parapedobacter indicus]SFI26336.1 Histidine kinase-, DNA gyrase B-, and HSP90-like ATPase [Parapedobacter indicus]